MKRKLRTILMGFLVLCGVTAQAKTVVNYPTVESKPYTGSEQTPTVPGSPDYDVISASSGTGVGGYDIYLALTDSDNTKWPDTDEEVGTMKWYITKAANAWTTEPSIESWTYGDPASTPVAAAKFGTPTVTFSGTAKDGTTYTDVTSVAKAGNYTCKFTVAGTDNYEGLDPVVKNFEIKVAVPGGGGGGSGNVNISVTGYDGPYDGSDHQINVSITGDDAPTFSVGYSETQEGPFQSDNSFKYKEIGTHTVWYRLQSVNYATVTNSAVVKISQREITPPTVAPKEYNGEPQSADITETADYTVEYNGAFTDAGTHENAVVLALKDSVHCKWADGAEDPVLLSFTITKSSGNVWLTEPSITGWKYGESAHIPVAVPKYGVVSVLYDGTTTDGVEIKDATAVSKAGSYTAKFTVPETTSYNGLSKNVTFEIERGKIDIGGGGGGSGGAKLEVGNYTGTYDGDEHTASIAVTGDASSSFVLTYSLAEAGPYTLDKPTFSNACETTKIWYSVSSPDYQTITNYATVAIDKRKVTLTSATDSKKYTGTALTAKTVTVTGDGWAEAEDATYDVTGSQTIVGTSKNTFSYSLKGGAKEQNYSIDKVEGDLTVEKAKINDGEEPGGGSVPAGGVSKFDKTFEYDGKGHTIDTNEIVKAFGGVIVGDFEIHFMDDESGALGDRALPVVTNVCVTSVWYKVTSLNYDDFVHEVRLTITARDIAKATIAPIPDVTYADKPATPVPVVTDGTPSIITANDYTVSYLNNAKPGTATVTLTGKGNYTGSKSTTFVIKSAGTIKYAALKGTLAWKLNLGTGCYTAQLNLICTNGLAQGISNLRFIYQDRMDGEKIASALYNSKQRTYRPTIDYSGTTYRSVDLDATRIVSENVEVLYGVKDVSQAKGIVAANECLIELYVRTLANPVSDLGYVVWTSNGTQCKLPVTASGEPQGMVVKDSLKIARLAAAPMMSAPLSLSALNTSLALGVALDPASSPYCKLTDFTVGANGISGRVEVGKESAAGEVTQGILGTNARVVLMGAKNLVYGFAEIGSVPIDENGAFQFALGSDEYQFFKVKVEVENVVE